MVYHVGQEIDHHTQRSAHLDQQHNKNRHQINIHLLMLGGKGRGSFIR